MAGVSSEVSAHYSEGRGECVVTVYVHHLKSHILIRYYSVSLKRHSGLFSKQGSLIDVYQR